MKTPKKPSSHKLGANHNEMSARDRKRDKNFKQSLDVREDRGARQTKMATENSSILRTKQ